MFLELKLLCNSGIEFLRKLEFYIPRLKGYYCCIHVAYFLRYVEIYGTQFHQFTVLVGTRSLIAMPVEAKMTQKGKYLKTHYTDINA